MIVSSFRILYWKVCFPAPYLTARLVMINRSLLCCREKIRWEKRVCFVHNVKERRLHVKERNAAKRFTIQSPEEVLRLWMRPNKVCHQVRRKALFCRIWPQWTRRRRETINPGQIYRAIKDLMIIILVAAILSVVTLVEKMAADAIIIQSAINAASVLPRRKRQKQKPLKPSKSMSSPAARVLVMGIWRRLT